MTALGLVVAVPAVLAYNWLIRRNKSIMEDLAAFTNDMHGYLMSAGAVKPRIGGRGPGVRARRRPRPAELRPSRAASRFAPAARDRAQRPDDRQVIANEGPARPDRASVRRFKGKKPAVWQEQ